MGPANVRESSDPLYRTFGFIGKEMADYLAAADCVVCRAGANTLAELSLLGKAAVLIPLMAGAGRGDQVKNAGLFQKHGAALVLEGENANPEKLKKAISAICDHARKQKELSHAIRSLAHAEASEKIVAEILSITDPHA